jgi:hypothetical protein
MKRIWIAVLLILGLSAPTVFAQVPPAGAGTGNTGGTTTDEIINRGLNTGPDNRIDRFNDLNYSDAYNRNLYLDSPNTSSNIISERALVPEPSQMAEPDLNTTPENYNVSADRNLKLPDENDYYENNNLNQNRYLQPQSQINGSYLNQNPALPGTINTPPPTAEFPNTSTGRTW